MTKRVVIVGGGPSGMMAAIAAKQYHPDAQVTLLERNPVLGKKMRLTGGGRCNVTADVPNETVIAHTPKNGKFLYSSLTHFNPRLIQDFFVREGCALKVEDHQRIFPQSNKAADVVAVLEEKMVSLGVAVVCNTKVVSVRNHLARTETDAYPFDALILATGSKALPPSGSDGNGYALALSLGHTITELLPAEVPLVSNDAFIQSKALQGLSFKDVTIAVDCKPAKTIRHDLLFTHFGISGPAALRASFAIIELLKHQAAVRIFIDFVPDMSLADIMASSATDFIPKRLNAYLQAQASDPQVWAELVKRFPMTIHATRGFGAAFVTNGGVDVKDISPKTMKSKIDPHLSFCGELMDVNSYTGGYNITSALVTGYSAGKHVFSHE